MLKTADGKVIAVGDQIAVARGSRVQSRLVLRFRDGSLDDETTVYDQAKQLRLISDRHIQKGPSYPDPYDMSFTMATGTVTTRTWKDGKDETKTEHMDLPPDMCNGIVPAIVANFQPGSTAAEVPYLIATPKPRVVKLAISSTGPEAFSVSGSKRESVRYDIHIRLGGLTGVVAPLVGKEPSDYTLWMMAGEAPVFLKLEGALYLKGPMWTMELTSPVWAKQD